MEETIFITTDIAKEVFDKYKEFEYLEKLIHKAIELAGNDRNDLQNIADLGEGWVAEETLAIAIYCALKYQNDFSKGIIAAVNHSGDSDSTGAVTGNILGTWLGESAIEERWTRDLELWPFITIMADDLAQGCPLYDRDGERSNLFEDNVLTGRFNKEKWVSKYVKGHYISIMD